MQGVSGIAHVVACHGVGEELCHFVRRRHFPYGGEGKFFKEEMEAAAILDFTQEVGADLAKLSKHTFYLSVGWLNWLQHMSDFIDLCEVTDLLQVAHIPCLLSWPHSGKENKTAPTKDLLNQRA